MKYSFSIRKRQTKTCGVAFDLDYKAVPGKGQKGMRFRPLIGYNLTRERARTLALEMIEKIDRYVKGLPSLTPESNAFTLADIVPLYWAAFKLQGRVDPVRPAGIIKDHLLPFFPGPLASLTYADGVAYQNTRKEAGATDGTIRREYQLLMRILNLAVANGQLEKNRLVGVPKPKGDRRTRVATIDELLAIQREASMELWRVVIVALNTGLRIGRIFAIESPWIERGKDGWWLVLPAPRSTLKKHPPRVPLNTLAVQGLLRVPEQSNPSGRVWSWKNRRSLTKAWDLACEKAGVQDFHFHDLRHTFTTKLQGLGVGYEVRQALLGHSMKGETQNYSHGSTGWDQHLQKAVTLLERSYRKEKVVYKVVYAVKPG